MQNTENLGDELRMNLGGTRTLGNGTGGLALWLCPVPPTPQPHRGGRGPSGEHSVTQSLWLA